MAKLSEKNPTGTSFHMQTITCSYNELVVALGKPQVEDNCGQDKVNFEWICETKNGILFTIYDWKEYRTIHPNEEIEWHIGGESSIDTIKARKELEALIYDLNSNC